MKDSLFWYDCETSGIDPRYDRIVQFAGLRTDLDLNIIEEPLIYYCKLSPEILPDPYSSLITGITPQLLEQKGLSEAEFCQKILAEFIRPHTCVVGYNNIRFDDEFMRFLFYRNLHEPYAREWQNGNSRWDLLDLVRAASALKPHIFNWPKNAEGYPSYRLEELTASNGLPHANAHDALSDVKATLKIAQLILAAEPKFFKYFFNNRLKNNLKDLLKLPCKKPVLHTSGMYAAEYFCTTIVAPLAPHPQNANGVIVYDLKIDPSLIFTATPEELRSILFTKDHPQRSQVPLKIIHLNKCPIVAPTNVLTPALYQHLKLDPQIIQANFSQLAEHPELLHKVQAVYAEPPSSFGNETDPEFDLYANFISAYDKQIAQDLHASSAENYASFARKFRDPRWRELLFRYRARNFSATLSIAEQERWQHYCRQRLTFDQFESKMAEIQNSGALDAAKLAILSALNDYVQELKHKYA